MGDGLSPFPIDKVREYTHKSLEDMRPAITESAEFLAKEEKTYDEWVWLTAEAGVTLFDKLSTLGQLEPDQEIPSTKQAAEQLASEHKSIDELQWLLAERRNYLELL